MSLCFSLFFVSYCFQGSRGAILTTHSMEEADALCSRVGIMVKGELRLVTEIIIDYQNISYQFCAEVESKIVIFQ